jgi:hypothetical protein
MPIAETYAGVDELNGSLGTKSCRENSETSHTFFIVRATMADPAKRAAFDDRCHAEHLPDAMKAFGAQKAWWFWSESDPAVHQATYRFAGRAALDGG